MSCCSPRSQEELGRAVSRLRHAIIEDDVTVIELTPRSTGLSSYAAHHLHARPAKSMRWPVRWSRRPIQLPMSGRRRRSDRGRSRRVAVRSQVTVIVGGPHWPNGQRGRSPAVELRQDSPVCDSCRRCAAERTRRTRYGAGTGLCPVVSLSVTRATICRRVAETAGTKRSRRRGILAQPPTVASRRWCCSVRSAVRLPRWRSSPPRARPSRPLIAVDLFVNRRWPMRHRACGGWSHEVSGTSPISKTGQSAGAAGDPSRQARAAGSSQPTWRCKSATTSRSSRVSNLGQIRDCRPRMPASTRRRSPRAWRAMRSSRVRTQARTPRRYRRVDSALTAARAADCPFATRTMYDQGVGLQHPPSSDTLAPDTSVRLNPVDSPSSMLRAALRSRDSGPRFDRRSGDLRPGVPEGRRQWSSIKPTRRPPR